MELVWSTYREVVIGHWRADELDLNLDIGTSLRLGGDKDVPNLACCKGSGEGKKE